MGFDKPQNNCGNNVRWKYYSGMNRRLTNVRLLIIMFCFSCIYSRNCCDNYSGGLLNPIVLMILLVHVVCISEIVVIIIPGVMGCFEMG